MRTDRLILESYTDEARVYVEGEVSEPGMYSVPKGSTLLEAIKLAGIKKTSKIDHIDPKTIISDGERIKIRALKLIKIRLLYPNGHEEELELAKGTKIDAIHNHIEDPFLKANWKSRRKILQDGDVIHLANH